jgi:hypothetical protein
MSEEAQEFGVRRPKRSDDEAEDVRVSKQKRSARGGRRGQSENAEEVRVRRQKGQTEEAEEVRLRRQKRS